MSTEPPCRGVIINKLESHLNKPKTQTEIVYPQVIQGSGHRQIQMVQVPLFKGFSRQEYWSGLPGDLPDPGIEPRSPVLQTDSLLTELQGKPPGSSHHMSK